MAKKRRIGSTGNPRFLSRLQVALQYGHRSSGQWQPTGLEELGVADIERMFIQPNISHTEMHDLTDAQSRAVSQHEDRVQRQRPQECVRRWKTKRSGKEPLDLFWKNDLGMTASSLRFAFHHTVLLDGPERRIHPSQRLRQHPTDLQPFDMSGRCGGQCYVLLHQHLERLSLGTGSSL